jgi:hypothetical protein
VLSFSRLPCSRRHSGCCPSSAVFVISRPRLGHHSFSCMTSHHPESWHPDVTNPLYGSIVTRSHPGWPSL